MTTIQVTPQPHHDNWGPRLLRWTPRVLGILFVAFLSIFALDVFGVGYSPWETAVALFMHLLPNLVLLAFVVVGWRWPWVGTIGFVGFAVFWLISFAPRGFDPITVTLLAGLPALIGLLYLVDWLVRRRRDA